MPMLTTLLKDWETFSAQLLESYLSYPVLAFYRSQHDDQSWLCALCAVMDACALIEKSEIAAVQGQQVSDAKPSNQDAGQFVVSQCFYQTASFDHSVSLALMQRGPKNADRDAMKEFWARFRARKGGDEEEASEEK